MVASLNFPNHTQMMINQQHSGVYTNTMWSATATNSISTVSVAKPPAPTDPMEIAQLRLEGKCTECMHLLPDHDWHCSQALHGGTLSMANGGTGAITLGTTNNHSMMVLGDPSPEWVCDVFGTQDIMRIRVPEGKQPNWFHRRMQKLFFGTNWSKK